MENQFHIIEMLENLEKKSSTFKQADGTVVDMSNVDNALRDLVYAHSFIHFMKTDISYVGPNFIEWKRPSRHFLETSRLYKMPFTLTSTLSMNNYKAQRMRCLSGTRRCSRFGMG